MEIASVLVQRARSARAERASHRVHRQHRRRALEDVSIHKASACIVGGAAALVWQDKAALRGSVCAPKISRSAEIAVSIWARIMRIVGRVVRLVREASFVLSAVV